MDYQEAISRAAEAVAERNLAIVKAKVEEGLSYAEIARRWQISRARAHQIVRKHLDHITHPANPPTAL